MVTETILRIEFGAHPAHVHVANMTALGNGAQEDVSGCGVHHSLSALELGPRGTNDGPASGPALVKLGDHVPQCLLQLAEIRDFAADVVQATQGERLGLGAD
jgi:hypothetical protein